MRVRVSSRLTALLKVFFIRAELAFFFILHSAVLPFYVPDTK